MDRVSFRYRYSGTQYQFSAQAPYTEGHRLTGPEAQALNALRAERVQENVRPCFTEAAEAEASAGLLSEATVASIQAKIDAYDCQYQFQPKAQSTERLGAVEREARIIARARAAEGASDEEIELLAQSIDLVAEARERVEVRAKITASAMEDLLA